MRLFAIYFAFLAALAAAFTQSRTTTAGEILGAILLVVCATTSAWFIARCLLREDSGVDHE